MNGGAGDDTLVWNNGDGTDVINGDDGRDDVEVNGAPTAGDVFTVQPNGARIKFDRTNLVPFSLDIGSSETMHANGLGGDDTITVGDVGTYAVTASGGSGNDTLTGGGVLRDVPRRLGQRHDHPRRRHRRRLRRRGRRPGQRSRQHGRPGPRRRRQRLGDRRRRRTSTSSTASRPSTGRRSSRLRPSTNSHANPVTHHGAAHGQGARKGDRVDHGELPGGLVRQLHRHAHGAHRRRVRLAGLKVVLQLGSARYSVAPGASKTVKVRLAKGSRRLAGRKGHLKVLAVAATGAAGKIAQSSQRLTLALGTATKTRG